MEESQETEQKRIQREEVEDTQDMDKKEDQLFKAVQKGLEADVRSLIRGGVDVNKMYKNNKTVLMVAAQNGHDNIVKMLIDSGADLDAQVEYAPTSRAKPIPDVNIRSIEGRTALMFAAENGYDNIVDILLKAGAKVNAEAKKDGETALTLVREELVLMRLVQLNYKLARKTHFMKEKDVSSQLNNEESIAQMDAEKFVSIIKIACPGETFSEEETDEMESLFQQVPVYKAIREKLLENGGYDIQNIENPETRYVPLTQTMISHRTEKL